MSVAAGCQQSEWHAKPRAMAGRGALPRMPGGEKRAYARRGEKPHGEWRGARGPYGWRAMVPQSPFAGLGQVAGGGRCRPPATRPSRHAALRANRAPPDALLRNPCARSLAGECGEATSGGRASQRQMESCTKRALNAWRWKSSATLVGAHRDCQLPCRKPGGSGDARKPASHKRCNQGQTVDIRGPCCNMPTR